MQSETFDYVVVGGGTAGPVAARRLAEYFPNASVLLVEAGPLNTGILHSTMAMGWEGLHHTDWDWRYTSQPMKHAKNRQIHLPRGKFLGGSSGMNGTLMLRGVQHDYDRLEQLGIKGWSWNDVLPFFRKSETFHPTNEMQGDSSVHGENGELHTTHHPLAPISKKIVESFLSTGLEWHEDMFSQGLNSGVGHVPRTVHNGIRTSGADFVTGDDIPSNLSLKLSHNCLRVITEATQGQHLRASAVLLRDNVSGVPLMVKATTEIVISCGSYNSPMLLMHSGIGDKAHLKQFNIPLVKHLPGVGKNLQDHIIVFNFFQVSQPGLTNDHLIYDTGAFEKTLAEYMTDKTGVLGSFPFGAFVFKRLDNELEDNEEWKEALKLNDGKDPVGADNGTPHVEYFWSEVYGGGPQHVDQPQDGQSAFALITMLFNPQARGTVELQSKNPLFPPKIEHNYLKSSLDLLLLAEANRFGAEVISKGSGTKDVIAGPWPQTRSMPDSLDDWKEYVREQAGTCYHPSGTCAMGGSPDPSQTLPFGSVVNDRLLVHGFSNLRVADVSILPLVITGHTQAPAYMIGEKAAAIIRDDALNKSKATS